jgi:hypothetical protein
MSEIEKNEIEKDIIKKIKNFLINKNNYPPYYSTFFSCWGLINPLYNACSDNESEGDRVLAFGNKYYSLWNDLIKEKTIKLIEKRCVGDSRYHRVQKNVIKATNYLRNKFEIELSMCINCKKQRDICESKNSYKDEFEKLGAVMRIIYQIRCNLFHGDKNELTGTGGKRNKLLVESGSIILSEILNGIKTI